MSTPICPLPADADMRDVWAWYDREKAPLRERERDLHAEVEKRRLAAGVVERYIGHTRGVKIDQVDGVFTERAMTAVELRARQPSMVYSDEIHKWACYAAFAYIALWDRIVDAFAGFVSPEEHDRRVTELLEANNREVERRRLAEEECAHHVFAARKIHAIAFGLSQDTPEDCFRALQDDGELHGAIHAALEGKCAQAWIDEQLQVERTVWRSDMTNAPTDRFLWLWCPEDRSRWLAMWQDGRWHGVDDEGLTRTDGYHKGSDRHTGWEITAWCELLAAPASAAAGGGT